MKLSTTKEMKQRSSLRRKPDEIKEGPELQNNRIMKPICALWRHVVCVHERVAKLNLILKPDEGESIYQGGSQIKLKAANIQMT